MGKRQNGMVNWEKAATGRDMIGGKGNDKTQHMYATANCSVAIVLSKSFPNVVCLQGSYGKLTCKVELRVTWSAKSG
jgi:hypothetical protein